MFNIIADKGIFHDIYLLDGRLQENDIPLLIRLGAEKAIFILDDFEGTEKGISNAFTLQEVFKNNYLLAYPPSNSFLSSYGFSDCSTTAVLIPFSRLLFVNQG